MKELQVRAFWDDEAKVWVAESEEVPGLATEADTVEGLLIKLERLIPELLELNYGNCSEAGRSREIILKALPC
jgi:predicted RNase H-like HicB family nuclease